MPGKEDWLARGLPTEGSEADVPRVWKLARQDVVTCALDDTVGEVRERILASPYGFGFVVSGSGCVLGRMRKSALDCDPSQPTSGVSAGKSNVPRSSSSE